MSSPSPTLQVPAANPSLTDCLKLLRKDVFLNLNCHHIATVQSFNATNQTATATINYQKTFFQIDVETGVYNPVLQSYPLLVDCPVVFLGGGNGALTFPIKTGDECLVLFNDRDINNWFAGSTTSGPATNRLHSFADAIILVGIRSLAHVLTNFDANRAVLRNGAAAVGVRSDNGKVLITNSYPTNSTTLDTLLQSLLTQLQNLTSALASLTVTGVTTGGSASGPPTNAATITTIGTNIGNIATQIGGLLE